MGNDAKYTLPMSKRGIQMDVMCLGILCADVLVRPVDTLPKRGKLDLVDRIEMQIGGCASNAAIDICRLGGSAGIISMVGADGFGDFVRETLTSEGVDIAGLICDPLVSTAASIVAIGSDGERSVMHCLGSNAFFNVNALRRELFENARALLIAGTFLMPAFDGPGTVAALKMGREYNLLCCLDTAWDAQGRWMNVLKPALPLLDWFMPSFDEAAMLAESEDVADIAETFIRLGCKNTVIKLGEQGCYVRAEDGSRFFSPGYSVSAVDTSGAGDSFCAGFIMGLLAGWPLTECAAFANAVGAMCVCSVGTTTGIRTLEETHAFIKRNALPPP